MSNNYWQTQNNQNGAAEPANQPRKSGLLSNYTNQPAAPGNRSAPQGPSAESPNQGGPPPQQQWNGPSFLERPMQMVQRWSAKMTALRRQGQSPIDPSPLVLYHSPQPSPLPGSRSASTRPLPWRRSRVQRITHLRKKRLERWQRTGPGSKRLSLTIFAVIAALLLLLLTSTTSYAYNFYQSELPQVQNLANLRIPQSTHIYDRNGVLLYTLYQNTQPGAGGRSRPISYQYLPGVLQDAQIAAEDPTFWTNDGIDPEGMLRALTQYTSNGGQITSGGSTITQQLIKNLSNNRQETFQRKANEAALAIGLTQQYPKWKILEMYFNDTPFGAQEAGVEAAVEDYFGIQPQCNQSTHKCIPAVAFLDRDLSKCTNPADYTTCASDPILALTRAAMLAGIPQNPTHLDPSVSNDNFTNLLNNRLPYVLGQMLADGMSINLGLGDLTKNKIDKGPITDAIVNQVEARAKTITIVGFHQTMLAPHFVQWVIDTLSQSLGNGDSNAGLDILERSGLNIYTTLDLNLEQFVEKDIQHNLRDRVFEPYTGWGPLNTVYNVNDSAAVVMNAKTGEILAMDGSADYNDSTNPEIAGQYNAATAYRQPGSSIKPIVYAAALEKGWYPGIKLVDNKTYFPDGASTLRPAQGSTYTPQDYGNGVTYHPGLPTDIRISLANSFNIPAIKALMFAGIDDVVTMAQRLGITAIDHNIATYFPGETPLQAYGPSFALGTAGIPVYQMVGAYQTFADNGIHVPYHNILDIYDNYGRNLYHYDTTHPNGAQVLSPQIAFLINNMLSDNDARHFEFTGINTLTMAPWAPSRPVAAKTGTTDSFKDNWTIGYTSSIVVGVWSGNANNAAMAHGVIGVSGAGPIWHDIITYASGESQLGMTPDVVYPTDPFPQPDGVIRASVNPINGLAGSGVTDWMLVNEQPQQSGLPPACDPNNPNPNPDPNNPTGTCPPPGGTNPAGGGN